jgi:hypothetical protein
MGRWQPQTVRRFVRGFPTSAHTALVETDAGLGYLKAMGGSTGEGPHTLASEVVATQLAEWLGLPVFDWGIITIDPIDEIPFLDKDRNQVGLAQPGPAFITRAESGGSWSGGKRDLARLINPEDVSALVVFDTWVLNCDRHCPKPRGQLGKPRVNRDNVFLSEEAPPGHFLLKAMDHTHCFSCGHAWTRKLSEIGRIQDDRLFGLFPAFRSFLKREAVIRAAARLATIDRMTVVRMAERLPKEWDVSQTALDALINLILGRATYLADKMVNKIWPQKPLPTDEGDDAEQTS